MGGRFKYLDWKDKKIHMVCVLFCVILVAFLVCGFNSTDAKESKGGSDKYYKSIAIEKGDTLWSIATEHMSPEYRGIEEYILEISRLNHLSDDKIYAGEYLTIPYYGMH